MYMLAILRTHAASSSLTASSFSSSLSYPYGRLLITNVPCRNRFTADQWTFWDMFSDSCCATAPYIVSIPSLSSVMVFRRSFSKYTLTPISFRWRTVDKVSTVFLANRVIDLVSMRSILPFSHSSSIRWKSSLPHRLVPLMPSSA